jgi:dTMP kinase
VPETFPNGSPSRVRESGVVTRGLFVTFEGIEGCGKTTQLNRAADWLRARGHAVLTTREPGGTALGKLIRNAVLHARESVEAGAELLLMVGDRRQHLFETIEPALAAGTVVLCDRYADSSRAYQGAGRGLGEAAVDELHRRWCPRVPDRTYLFDCPVEVALARVAKRRGASYDRFEKEEVEFHRRVRAAYRRRARKEPGRFVVIDASRSADNVFLSLEENLQSLFRTRGRA